MKEDSIKELLQIPGVGKSIANNLWTIGICSISDLKGKDPDILYQDSNRHAGTVQDRCLLYVFRCAVYYANTDLHKRKSALLQWWNWKDKT